MLLRPKFDSRASGRMLSRWFGLDRKKPLSALLQKLRQQGGDRIEPADQRLQLFIDDLIRKRLIDPRF